MRNTTTQQRSLVSAALVACRVVAAHVVKLRDVVVSNASMRSASRATSHDACSVRDICADQTARAARTQTCDALSSHTYKCTALNA
jgi:hypothetical protein